ncbi:MAG TPA: RecX family transcriptional regulator [Candidatus Avirikenella pullistercoris]|nr:RecX family transcriptional regulator [Candidatus Avirikenella pullistercoris]
MYYGKKEAKKRVVTPEGALSRLMILCSRAEKCEADARLLLARWDIGREEGEKIMERLIREGYVDNRRYAVAFVRDKAEYNGWGEHKITDALRRKGISSADIAFALQHIDRKEMREKLRKLLIKKRDSVIAGNEYELKGKLIRFALSKGFGYDEAVAMADDIL